MGYIKRSLVSASGFDRRSFHAVFTVAGVLGIAACGESATAPSGECQIAANPVPTGTLVRNAEGFLFTASDGWSISVLHEVITIRGPQHPDYVEFWGISNLGELSGNHENHNGKHVKDRLGDRRSVRLPSGALMTMVSEGLYDPMLTLSIYEGSQSHTIDMRTRKLTHSCSGSASTAVAREEAEADGETASLMYKPDGATLFTNEYTQDVSSSGVPLGKVFVEQPLSETGGPSNPNQINDFYDDPRLPHT